jgi:hypothetical protein
MLRPQSYFAFRWFLLGGLAMFGVRRRVRTIVLCATLVAGLTTVFAPTAGAATAGFAATPTDGLPAGGRIHAFATAGADHAWAVGKGTGTTALIAHWDGTAWQLDELPGISGTLNGAVAVSASDVWAVGWRWNADRTADLPLILHWDGSSWTEVAPPPVAEGTARLADVATGVAGDVWAVGSRGLNPMDFGSDARPYVLRWDGTTWQESSLSVPVGTEFATLSSVSVAGAEVWAAGFASVRLDDGSYRYRGLVEHWDGLNWTMVPTAAEPDAPEGNLPFVQRIAAVSVSDVWLLGQIPQTSSEVVQRWDGNAWASGPELPDYLTTSASGTLSVDHAGRVWTANTQIDRSNGELRPVIGCWDGSTWVAVPILSDSMGRGGPVATTRTGETTWAAVESTGSTYGPPVILRYQAP